MVRQGELTSPTPFHSFICTSCGKTLGKHFLFRPDKLTDVVGGAGSRKGNGKLYCHRDQVGWAGSYYQRELKRTMERGYNQNGC